MPKTANNQEMEQRLEHLEELKKQAQETISDFCAEPSDVEAAQLVIREVDKEIATIKAMVAGKEVFGDGAQIEKQFADEDGNTFVKNDFGRLEPDITSQSCSEEGVPDEGAEPSVKKRGLKNKEVKSTSQEESTTPGYNLTPHKTWIVGPTPPEYGYARFPDYSDLYHQAEARGISEKDYKKCWEQMQALVAKEFKEDKILESDWHTLIYAKVEDAIFARTTPKIREMVAEEETELLREVRRILREHKAPEACADRVIREVVDNGKKTSLKEILPFVHVEAANIASAIGFFSKGEGEVTDLSDEEYYADRYRMVEDRIDRIKEQAKRMCDNDAALLDMAKKYINPDYVPWVQAEIKKSGKSVKYIDTLVARFQLRTLSGKFRIKAEDVLITLFGKLSDKMLERLGVEKVVTYKYDKNAMIEKVSSGSSVLPMSAFEATKEVTSLYIQGLKK